MTQLLQTIWHLRTHPFRPNADSQGKPWGPDILFKPLDPRVDERLRHFYFDFYDWQSSRLIQGLAPDVAFDRFPSDADLGDPKSLLILIAGDDQTGRESLRNLILYKIQLQSQSPPIVVKVTLDSQKPGENVKAAARVFMNIYNMEENRPSLEQLQKIYEQETKEQNAGSDTYSTLFQLWEPRVHYYCTRPLVLLLTGSDTYDNWQVIYNATRHLFNFIIVLTQNMSHAVSCYKLLIDKKKSVALIKAPALELQEARTYLQMRLTQERLLQVMHQDPLVPFTDEALNALYEAGPSAKPGDSIKWSIGWLNRTFSRMLDDHLSNLPLLAQQQGKQIQDLATQELLIRAGTARTARESINQGR